MFQFSVDFFQSSNKLSHRRKGRIWFAAIKQEGCLCTEKAKCPGTETCGTPHVEKLQFAGAFVNEVILIYWSYMVPILSNTSKTIFLHLSLSYVAILM